MSAISSINFHHLRYFWAVAKDGNLTRTARVLRVAPSALSSQIRQLEDQLGQPLFSREGRALALTEAGKVALAYADAIVEAGNELVSTLEEGRSRRQLLRVGAVATLSRNFQRSFVQPVVAHPQHRLRLTTGSLDELLEQLAAHELDVVLANRPADPTRFRSRLLARQSLSLVSSEPLPGFRLPDGLHRRPMILPGVASDVRLEFDAYCERSGVRPRVRVEVDDMATMRLLARDTDALVLVPSVVVRDELREGVVDEVARLADVAEKFYAITVERRFEHPLVRELVMRDEAQLLGIVADGDLPENPPCVEPGEGLSSEAAPMPLVISPKLTLDEGELVFQFARSSGPGGQNVNKVSTKAILRWNAATSPSLPEPVRARFLAKYASRLLADGSVLIARDASRSQLQNRRACLDELAAMITSVLVAPKKRKATRPTRGSTERRLAEKKRRSDTKRGRGSRGEE